MRIARPVTLDDPFYLAVDPDGSVKVYVAGRGTSSLRLRSSGERAEREDRP